MTHASKYWADKLPQEKRAEFWSLVGLGFSGGTAFARVELAACLEGPGLGDNIATNRSKGPKSETQFGVTPGTQQLDGQDATA